MKKQHKQFDFFNMRGLKIGWLSAGSQQALSRLSAGSLTLSLLFLLVVSPKNAFSYSAYVASQGDTVSVIDTGTNIVTATITVGLKPDVIVVAIFPPPNAPQNLSGHQKKNDFGLVLERFNRLTWGPNPLGAMAAGYFVYRNGVKIAILPASTLEYEDHNRKKGVTTIYTVTAFDATGGEGSPATISVK